MSTKITITVGEAGGNYLKEVLEAAKEAYLKMYKKEYSSDENPLAKLYIDTLIEGVDAVIASIGGEISIDEADFEDRTMQEVIDALTEPLGVSVGRKAAAVIAAQAES